MAASSAKVDSFQLRSFGKSAVYNRYSVGHSTLQRGTPTAIGMSLLPLS